MHPFVLKTFNPRNAVGPFSFYILSKGHNAGRPQKAPCPNCFICSCNSAEEADKYYWLTYWVWKAGAFTLHLYGSVILFIRIKDARQVILQAAERCADNPGLFQATVKQLERIDQLKQALNKQLAISQQIENSLIGRLAGNLK